MKPGESVISPLRIVATSAYSRRWHLVDAWRYFQESDNQGLAACGYRGRTIGQRFWSNRDPIGQRMYQRGANQSNEGPMKHTRWFPSRRCCAFRALEDLSGKGNPVGVYYFPYSQDPSNAYTLAIRTTGDSRAIVPTVRAKMAGIDPELPTFRR